MPQTDATTTTYPVYRPGLHRVVLELNGGTTLGELESKKEDLETGDLLWFGGQWFRWTGKRWRSYRRRVSRMVHEMVQ